jgi:hypothetical protein
MTARASAVNEGAGSVDRPRDQPARGTPNWFVAAES